MPSETSSDVANYSFLRHAGPDMTATSNDAGLKGSDIKGKKSLKDIHNQIANISDEVWIIFSVLMVVVLFTVMMYEFKNFDGDNWNLPFCALISAVIGLVTFFIINNTTTGYEKVTDNMGVDTYKPVEYRNKGKNAFYNMGATFAVFYIGSNYFIQYFKQ